MKNRCLLRFTQAIATILALSFAPLAHAALTAGDIAVLGFNADQSTDLNGDSRNDARWAIVALADIAAGEVVHFTDAGITETGAFYVNSANEGHLTWTVTTKVPAGTILTMDTSSGVNFSDLNGTASGKGGLSDYGTLSGALGGTTIAAGIPFNASGDQIIVYQGTAGSSSGASFIYGFNTQQNGLLTGNGVWQTSGSVTASQQSFLPSGLTNGSTANALSTNVANASSGTGTLGSANYGFDNMAYQGTQSGTKASLLAAIATATNWVGDNATAYAFGVGSGFIYSSHFTVTVSTTINSLARQSPSASTTNASSVTYRATFGAAISGVTGTNFDLSPTVTGASIGTPTAVGGSPSTQWDIPVNTGTGDGTLTLRFINSTGTNASISTTLPFSGASYTIDKTAPSVSVGSPSAASTRGGPVSYTITYSDTNFSASTLTLSGVTVNGSGTASAGSVSVTGSGTTRTVTLSSITGDGTLGISIASGTASDTAGNTAAAAGPSTTFTVDNTAPVVTSAVSASGTYGSALSTYTIVASGSPVSYSASGLPSGLSINTGNGQITGTPLAAGNFSVTIGATDAVGNLGTATLALSVAQKTITVSGVTASNKTYDGNANATLGLGSTSLVGVIGGDSVTLVSGSASGAFNNKNVGAGKTVTVSGLTLSGTSSGNYSLTQPTTTANITAAGLSVSGVTALNKIYDGNANATLGFGSASLVGVVGGDPVTLVTGSAGGVFDNKNVGTGKTVTVSGLSLSGTDSGNYSLTPPTTTANITVAGLSVSGVTASNKTYDGNANATLGFGSASLVGVVGGDDVTLGTGSATGAFDTATVGMGKTVTVSGLALSGADSGNYTITQPTTTADITAVQLTVTADAKSRVYGAANPTLTATITGFVNSETESVLSGAAGLGTAADATSLPGGYTITAAIGTLSAANYTFVFVDGTLTVRKIEMADWELENFTASELLDPSISGSDADPDLDGVTNLYEYAFGTDPRNNLSGPFDLAYSGNSTSGYSVVEEGRPRVVVETPAGGGTTTRVFFIRRKTAYTSDLAYTVQFSNNGTTWVTNAASPTVLADDGIYELVAVTYPLTTGGKKTRYFQVVPSILL